MVFDRGRGAPFCVGGILTLTLVFSGPPLKWTSPFRVFGRIPVGTALPIFPERDFAIFTGASNDIDPEEVPSFVSFLLPIS